MKDMQKKRAYGNFDSLERVQQYLEIEQEPKPTQDGVPPAYWPASGDLRVEKLSARYSEVSLCSGIRSKQSTDRMYRMVRLCSKMSRSRPAQVNASVLVRPIHTLP